MVALTFDDGPDPHGTLAVLELLSAFSIPATFFMLTAKAKEHPAVVEQVVSQGHTVGLHSDVHSRLDRMRSKPLARRLSSARGDLERLSGTSVRHHRPPFGRTSRRSLRAAAAAALHVVMWSHDPRDWDESMSEPLEDRLTRSLVAGGIVLLHDGSDAFPSQGENTARALRETLPLLSQRGLRAITLSDLP